MRFRELVATPIDETERRGRQQSGFTAPDPERAGPTTALRDGRECRDRHCLDRAFLAALPVIANCPIEDSD